MMVMIRGRRLIQEEVNLYPRILNMKVLRASILVEL